MARPKAKRQKTPPAPDRDEACHRANGSLLENFKEIGKTAGRLVRRAPGEEAGGYEFIRLEEGFYLLLADVRHVTPIRTTVMGEDLIEFHYRLNGRLDISGAWGAVRIARPSLLFWWQPSGFDDVTEVIEADSSGRDTSISLYCSRDWFRKTLGGDEIAGPLIEKLMGASSKPNYRLLPSRVDAVVAAQALMRNSYTGGLRLMHAKARALELICGSIAALSSTPEGREHESLRLTDRDLSRLEEARAILTAEFDRPPRMARLARRVGLNSTKLTNGFKYVYDETMHEFVRRMRLEKGKELLITTDLQISQVAERVGYAHHSTFTAAFTEWFGFPPRAALAARRVYGKERQS